MRESQTSRFWAGMFNGLPAWMLGFAGVILLAASLFADALGFGGQPGVIGWKQLTGAVIGGLITFTGGWIGLRMARYQERVASDLDFPPLAETDDDAPIYDSAALRVPFVHELAELYEYRFLLWNLISRDLKVRYKRSVLGFFWAMVNPLLTMAVLVLVFTRLFRFDVENYPLYVLSGLLIWNLYSRGSSVAMRSVLDSSSTRKKIYIPASVFLAAAIGSALVNLLFALPPLLLLAMLMGVSPKLTWLMLPLPILQTAVLAFGVGTILASLVVFFADMLDIYEVVLSVYFYLTPIIYPIGILPSQFFKLEQLNPLYHFIDLFRASLTLGELIPPERIVLPTLAALGLLTIGWSLFTRLSDQFAYRA